jgi:23S rRNA U2552 (ribose-2'-O)-methylase RlmE/FtsJ
MYVATVMDSDFFVTKIFHFIEEQSLNNMVKGTFWNLKKKKSSHFEEESYEIVNFLGKFG